MSLKNIFKDIKDKFNLKEGWLPFLNMNLKWAVAFFIRMLTILFTLFLIVTIINKTGLIKDIRKIVVKDVLDIKEKKTTVISSPNINYNSDLKNIDDTIKMLEKKKEKMKKAKNNEKTNNTDSTK